MYYIYSIYIYIFTSPTKVLVPLRHFWSHPQFDPKSSEGENPPSSEILLKISLLGAPQSNSCQDLAYLSDDYDCATGFNTSSRLP